MAVNVVQTTLASRRFGRWFPWLAAAVLVAGVIAFSVAYFGGNSTTESSAPTGPPIALPKPPKNIPFPAAAWRVAQQFLNTAVARKDVAASYAITDPAMRQGMTLKQWKTGNLPGIPFFPIAKIYKFNWKNTNYAHPRDAQISVVLMPRRGSGQRAIYAQVGLGKIGRGARARWVVNYFGPLGGPPVPTPK
jgi:hypothetical protein